MALYWLHHAKLSGVYVEQSTKKKSFIESEAWFSIWSENQFSFITYLFCVPSPNLLEMWCLHCLLLGYLHPIVLLPLLLSVHHTIHIYLPTCYIYIYFFFNQLGKDPTSGLELINFQDMFGDGMEELLVQ